MKTFWEFCEERDSIREKKSSGVAAPWTDDEILRINHFTNVDRNFDKGTIFIEEKLILMKMELIQTVTCL